MKHVGIVYFKLLLEGEYLEDGEGFGDVVEINAGKFIDLCQ
jgi:hypothetical protein